jgi:hypothetical protein
MLLPKSWTHITYLTKVTRDTYTSMDHQPIVRKRARSNGKGRFILYSKLALSLLNVLFTWDISNVVDIVEAIVESFSEHH